MAAFHRRPITSAARYLLVDGLWVSVRESAGRARRRASLAVYGIDAAGGRGSARLAPGDVRVGGRLGCSAAQPRRARPRPGAVAVVAADGAGGIAVAVVERRACLCGRRAIHRARTRRTAVQA